MHCQQNVDQSKTDLNTSLSKAVEQSAVLSKLSEIACNESSTKINQIADQVLGDSGVKGQTTAEKSMEAAVASSSVCSDYVNGSWFIYASNDVTCRNAAHACTTYGSIFTYGCWHAYGIWYGLWGGNARHEWWIFKIPYDSGAPDARKSYPCRPNVWTYCFTWDGRIKSSKARASWTRTSHANAASSRAAVFWRTCHELISSGTTCLWIVRTC
ncbi:hypothetical protein V8G54_030481 [Vigna mungo]|uniref:Uncharacterized protein n=1 Tax=Vigna mungo TaxID=3915 RepID=A0AAQ3MW82_VIGMU